MRVRLKQNCVEGSGSATTNTDVLSCANCLFVSAVLSLLEKRRHRVCSLHEELDPCSSASPGMSTIRAINITYYIPESTRR